MNELWPQEFYQMAFTAYAKKYIKSSKDAVKIIHSVGTTLSSAEITCLLSKAS
jgi:hypothetical protein